MRQSGRIMASAIESVGYTAEACLGGRSRRVAVIAVWNRVAAFNVTIVSRRLSRRHTALAVYLDYDDLGLRRRLLGLLNRLVRVFAGPPEAVRHGARQGLVAGEARTSDEIAMEAIAGVEGDPRRPMEASEATTKAATTSAAACVSLWDR